MRVIRRRRLPFLRRPSEARSPQDVDAALQKFADLPPYQRIWFAQVLIGLGLLAGSSPVELAVPLIRTLTRQRGVQAGAAVGSLLSFAVGQAYTVSIRNALESEDLADKDSDRPDWFDRWMTKAIFAGAVALPAAGGLLPGTVVLRSRSPLWGFGLWVLVRLLAALVLAEDASRLRKRREAQAEDTSPGSTDGV